MTTTLTPRVRQHETQRLANAGHYNRHLTESIEADCVAGKWGTARWRAHSIRNEGLRERALGYIEVERAKATGSAERHGNTPIHSGSRDQDFESS